MKKQPNKESELEGIRHSLAHVLAAAVRELYPGAQNTIGPAIENGFYQDFDLGKHVVSDADLPAIEAKMRELLPRWSKWTKKNVTLREVKKEFAWNKYKVELAEEFAKEKKQLTFYTCGGLIDLCKGGHILPPSAIDPRSFKLDKLAGAYWRGDEKKAQLTRIYGLAFPTKQELDEYLRLREEAKKRDHKKLGAELRLFMFSQSVGPGLPMLLPHGAMVRSLLEQFAYDLKREYGLTFVWTPHIARSELYKQSKHWQKYDAMMPPLKVEGDEYTLKPMNCPHHFQIYLNEPRSYRDLPLRFAENGTVYRYEKSGEINGLLRVRALTQDDSHWFVPHENLAEEINRALELTKKIYTTFGLNDFYARISSHDPKNFDKYLGSQKTWKAAEKALVAAVTKQDMQYSVGVGEAAFYGPKIDIMIRDSLHREWQVTTIQLDFNQPENFNLLYVDKDGKEKRPAVLHVAIFGSIERFLAILIEHFAGAFPVWLAPVQATVLPVGEKFSAYAEKIVGELKAAGIRAELSEATESLGKRIRGAEMQKTPYVLVVGEKEETAKSVNIRRYKENAQTEMKLPEFMEKIGKEIKDKTL